MPFNPFINRETPLYVPGEMYTYTQVVELTYKKWHDVWDFAPCSWSRDRGATHTLLVNDRLWMNCHGTRPARLLKTRLYVGVDEQDDDIVWENWAIKIKWSSLQRNSRPYNLPHNLQSLSPTAL